MEKSEDPLIGTWKVIEVSGKWLIENEKTDEEKSTEKNWLNPEIKKRKEIENEEEEGSENETDEELTGSEEALANSSSASTKETDYSQITMDVNQFIENDKIEIKVYFDDEGHCKWSLRNSTNREFENPFQRVEGYTSEPPSTLFLLLGSGNEFIQFDVIFNVQGNLTLQRDDDSFLILEKVVENKQNFSLKDALKGKESFSDISFTSSDFKKILAHKVILKARCPKLVEPQGIQMISSFNHKTIQDFFYYLYTDQLPLHEKTRDEISDLVQISDLFNLPKLKSICIQWIESSQFKNEIIQLLTDIKSGVNRIDLLCDSNFLENSESLMKFLKKLVEESSSLISKFWLVCAIYGSEKKELSRVEKKDLLEESRSRTLEILFRIEDIVTKLSRKLEDFPEETIDQLIIQLLPKMENAWDIVTTVSLQFKQGMKILTQAAKEGGKKKLVKKFLETKKIFKRNKIRKELLGAIDEMTTQRDKFNELSPEEKELKYLVAVRSFLDDIFFNDDIGTDFRKQKLEKFAQDLTPKNWKEYVNFVTSLISWISIELERNKSLISPYLQQINQVLKDKNFMSTLKRLNIISDESKPAQKVGHIEHFDNSGTLSQAIKGFIRNHEFSDLTFIVEGEEIPAHRVIVASSSEHFNHSLQSNMREDTERKIVLSDISIDCFNVLLEYFYGGMDLKEDDHQILTELLKVSDQYAIDELKQTCSEFLRKYLDEENIFPLLINAELFSAPILKNAALDFLAQNFTLTESEEFTSLDPKLQEEVNNHTIEARKELFGGAFEDRFERPDLGRDFDLPIPPTNFEAPIESTDQDERVDFMTIEFLQIVGEDSDIEKIKRCILAADFDLSRALNFFYDSDL